MSDPLSAIGAPAPDRSVAHIGAYIALLDRWISALVAQRRSTDPNPDDPYRGLYVSDNEVDQLLRKGIDRVVAGSGVTPFDSGAPGASGMPTDTAASAVSEDLGFIEEIGRIERDAAHAGETLRLLGAARSFGLDPLDLHILVIAIAADIDPRFEKLFGYLHDDVTRKRPSIGLCLELLGRAFADADARGRFSPEATLASAGLLVVDDLDRPFLTRSVRVPDRVLAHLLGDARLDPILTRLWIPAVDIDAPGVEDISRAVRAGFSPIYVHDEHSGGGLAIGASALRRAGLDALVLDFALATDEDPAALSRVALREARLRASGLVVGLSGEGWDERGVSVGMLTRSAWPVLVVGSQPWDPAWTRVAPHIVRATRLEPEVGYGLWRRCLVDGADTVTGGEPERPFSFSAPPSNEISPSPEGEPAYDVTVTAQFRLRPDQIVRAAATARVRAGAEGRALATDDLLAGARAQNSSRLERLARRVEPAVDWDDLVLPPEILVQLRDVAWRYRSRAQVYGDWLMGGKNNRRLGVTALFAGPSGVGKTMAAEALASALGLNLYTINLATVVDKYIGETEKNLERIFVAAEGVNGVIFFDEADALFGKRSEVNDARDRYANVEVAYLLQRLETFEGIGVLATNLRTNIDEAFTRRLDALIDFPEPEEEYRLVLWDRCLGRHAPRGDDLDLAFLAKRFKLSGGNIRNIAVTAAFLAAEADRPVAMADLIVGTAREYRKLGRMCTQSEFGPYYAIARGDG